MWPRRLKGGGRRFSQTTGRSRGPGLVPLSPLCGPSNPTPRLQGPWGPAVTAPWQVGSKTAA